MLADREKQGWAQMHACRLEFRFSKWQKPLGIDGEEYLKYLNEELEDYYDDPLQKSLIELIS